MEHVSMEELRKMGDTHMIVAALVATVTFTAGLSVPGGFYQHNDPDPGTAILSKHTAFKAFIITDAIALMLSISAIVYYFDAARKSDLASLRSTYRIAGLAITEALIAMMIAFAAGTYAVLATSSGKDIAIAVCVIGSVTVFLNYLYFLGYFCSCLLEEIDGLEGQTTN